MRRALAFYKFVEVIDPESLVLELQRLGERHNVVGTILLANEGVNGTVIAQVEDLKSMVRALQQAFGEMTFKWSDLDQNGVGFNRFKVRVKPEIVSFGVEDLDLRQT
ncbi:MAG: hypothetical protein VXX02_00335, partial [Pseudomonadota bacterium]|nr:hypothetical protein [Pseudomonadota bacterium]